jgi:hypothetical protein
MVSLPLLNQRIPYSFRRVGLTTAYGWDFDSKCQKAMGRGSILLSVGLCPCSSGAKQGDRSGRTFRAWFSCADDTDGRPQKKSWLAAIISRSYLNEICLSVGTSPRRRTSSRSLKRRKQTQAIFQMLDRVIDVRSPKRCAR